LNMAEFDDTQQVMLADNLYALYRDLMYNLPEFNPEENFHGTLASIDYLELCKPETYERYVINTDLGFKEITSTEKSPIKSIRILRRLH